MLSRLLCPSASKGLAYGYLIALSLSYLIVAVHTPITVYPAAGHDDALYMKLGQSLSEGHWLGPYNQYTLMKGPGYPGFLAVAHWLGISVSFAHALFHCSAVTFFVVVCHNFIRSRVFSAVLFALLLWHPLPLGTFMLRIVREEIYYGQVLIVLASLAGALFYPRTVQRMLLAALCGGVLGWFWITREEGVWIIPGLAILSGAAVIHAFRARRVRQLAATLSIAAVIFAGTQVGFRAINWFIYGGFVGVDVKETHFQRALGALDSVRSGGVRPFVSVTRAARERIYAVSPTFASLRQYLEASHEGWGLHSCNTIPVTCGEVGAGWFLWALRDAAAVAGRYSSPTTASAFFRQIADEVSSACARGDLECVPQLIAAMPPVNWQEFARRLPDRYVDASKLLLLWVPPAQLNPSGGPPDELARKLRFLNYPLISPPLGASDTVSYTLWGWYYKSGQDWFTAQVRAPDGSSVPLVLERLQSPDIQARMQDPQASNQRFMIRTLCTGQCVLRLETPAGAQLEKKVVEFTGGPVNLDLGPGQVYIQSGDAQIDPLYVKTRLEELCNRIRLTVLSHYRVLSVPVLLLGVIGFSAATLLYWKRAIWNTCYVLALACWVLAFVRTSLLILIDLTSFPALFGFYLAPAYFLLAAAAVLSCAAFAQLVSDSRAAIASRTTAKHALSGAA